MEILFQELLSGESQDQSVDEEAEEVNGGIQEVNRNQEDEKLEIQQE